MSDTEKKDDPAAAGEDGGDGEKEEDKGTPFEKGGDNDCSDGPVQNRGCTDILCLLLYIAHWVFFIMLAGVAMIDGDVTKLMTVRDFRGAYCGKSGNNRVWQDSSHTNYATLNTHAGRTYSHLTGGDTFVDSDYDMTGFEKTFFALNITAILTTAAGEPSNANVGIGATTICSDEMKTVMADGSCGTGSSITNSDFDALCDQVTGTTMSSSTAIKQDASTIADAVKNLPDFFTANCALSCTALSQYNQATNKATVAGARKYRFVPDSNIKYSAVMEKFWAKLDACAGSATTAMTEAQTLFEFDVLPASVCPYDASLCYPAPNFDYTEIGPTCMFKADSTMLAASPDADSYASMGTTLVDAVGFDFGKALGDVGTAWETLVITLFLALIYGFLFVVLLRFAVAYIVWGSILAVFMMFFGGGAYYYIQATVCGDDTRTAECPAANGGYKNTEGDRSLYESVAYVMFGLAGAYFLFILIMCGRIQLGIAINKVAARFVYQNKGIIFLPVVQTFAAMIWWLIWLVCAMFIMATIPAEDVPNGLYTYDEAYGTDDTAGICTGDATSGGFFKDTLTWKEVGGTSSWGGDTVYRCKIAQYNMDARFAYAFFSLLWTNALIIAVGQCTVAGAVAFWYFTKNEEKGMNPTIRPALRNCFRYHLGSLCVGSFILACVQFVKWWMYYLQKQAEATKNQFAALLAKIAQYLIACFERCIKFLNKNAYIQIALLGKNFCISAWNAFMLILRNAARIGVLAGIGFIVSTLGTIFIMLATGMSGYFILNALYEDGELYSVWLLTFFYFVIGFVISKLFMMVFGLAVDSVLQCFIADEEINSKTEGGAKNTPEELKAFMKQPKKGCCAKKKGGTDSDSDSDKDSVASAKAGPPDANKPADAPATTE